MSEVAGPLRMRAAATTTQPVSLPSSCNNTLSFASAQRLPPPSSSSSLLSSLSPSSSVALSTLLTSLSPSSSASLSNSASVSSSSSSSVSSTAAFFPPPSSVPTTSSRPQRNRSAPKGYENFVTHSNVTVLHSRDELNVCSGSAAALILEGPGSGSAAKGEYSGSEGAFSSRSILQGRSTKELSTARLPSLPTSANASGSAKLTASPPTSLDRFSSSPPSIANVTATPTANNTALAPPSTPTSASASTSSLPPHSSPRNTTPPSSTTAADTGSSHSQLSLRSPRQSPSPDSSPVLHSLKDLHAQALSSLSTICKERHGHVHSPAVSLVRGGVGPSRSPALLSRPTRPSSFGVSGKKTLSQSLSEADVEGSPVLAAFQALSSPLNLPRRSSLSFSPLGSPLLSAASDSAVHPAAPTGGSAGGGHGRGNANSGVGVPNALPSLPAPASTASASISVSASASASASVGNSNVIGRRPFPSCESVLRSPGFPSFSSPSFSSALLRSPLTGPSPSFAPFPSPGPFGPLCSPQFRAAMASPLGLLPLAGFPASDPSPLLSSLLSSTNSTSSALALSSPLLTPYWTPAVAASPFLSSLNDSNEGGSLLSESRKRRIADPRLVLPKKRHLSDHPSAATTTDYDEVDDAQADDGDGDGDENEIADVGSGGGRGDDTKPGALSRMSQRRRSSVISVVSIDGLDIYASHEDAVKTDEENLIGRAMNERNRNKFHALVSSSVAFESAAKPAEPPSKGPVISASTAEGVDPDENTSKKSAASAALSSSDDGSMMVNIAALLSGKSMAVEQPAGSNAVPAGHYRSSWASTPLHIKRLWCAPVPAGKLSENSAGESTPASATSPARDADPTGPPAMDEDVPDDMLGEENRLLTTPKAGNGSGSSCHQCKSRRHMTHLLVCCNMFNKKPGKGKRRICRKKYCWQCLMKFYRENPPQRGPRQNSWPCPACRGLCTCALCRRVRQEKTDQHVLQRQQVLDPATSLAFGFVYFNKLDQLGSDSRCRLDNLWRKWLALPPDLTASIGDLADLADFDL